MNAKRKKFFNSMCLLVVVSFFCLMIYMYFSALKIEKKSIDKNKIGITNKSNIKTSLVLGHSGEKDKDNLYCIGILSSGNTEEKEVRFTAIHEKTMVKLDGYDKTTFGDLYKEGGVELLMKGINSTFNLDIDKYISIDFSKIDEVINSIGPINVQLNAEDVSIIGDNLEIGTQWINGEQVEKYYSYRGITDSSFNIEVRYIAVMYNLIDKVLKENFFKAPIHLIKAKEALVTNYSNLDIVLKLSSLIGKEYKIKNLVVPIENTFSLQLQKEPNVYYINWEEERNKNVLRNFVINGLKPTGIK